ncbi:MAG: cobalamin B12-binding domain-containing protein [Planctomycetes bacterium]|nr:cobalamin B12-binding domain-containing protein [Planctomycetota bacterium]
MSNDRPIRVLLAKPGLDGHDRGIRLVLRALRDAGMEVIYTGLRATPEEIVRAAIDEDVEAIGLSSLSGAHETHFAEVSRRLAEEDASDILLFCGGIIPQGDLPKLHAAGFDGVFPPGTPLDDIVHYLRSKLRPDSSGAAS